MENCLNCIHNKMCTRAEKEWYDNDLSLFYCNHYLDKNDYQKVIYAHWDWMTEDRYECSNCGNTTRVDEYMGKAVYKYCPECGAKMNLGR